MPFEMGYTVLLITPQTKDLGLGPGLGLAGAQWVEHSLRRFTVVGTCHPSWGWRKEVWELELSLQPRLAAHET